MSAPAIKVEGLWKEYAVGRAQQQHGTFYDLLSHGLKAPFRLLRGEHGGKDEAERFWALRDINFEVQPGEVVGVIGRNGAGKSTLLKLLSRITAPTRGRIEMRGRLTSLLEVGTGFHPELSGRENIFLNGAILGMSRAEVVRKFDEIVAFAEIGKFVDTPVKRYSSGMYVRLAFAVAANLEPDTLVVDEVLAVGDAQFQKKCLGKMGEVSRRGRTVIFVSHNMEAMQLLCPKVMLLDAGALVSAGDAGSVIGKYLGDMEAGVGVVQIHADTLKLVSASGNYEPARGAAGELEVRIRLECLRDVGDLLIDFELANKQGVRIFQVVSAARGESPVAARIGNKVDYLIRFAVPALSPGAYFGTVYAYSKLKGVVLYQTHIPLFRAVPPQNAPECMSEGFTAVLIARYESRMTIEA